jgi:hypothetical protein
MVNDIDVVNHRCDILPDEAAVWWSAEHVRIFPSGNVFAKPGSTANILTFVKLYSV